MKIFAESTRPTEIETPILVLGLFEDIVELQEPVDTINNILNDAITKIMKAGAFKGKLGQTLPLYTGKKMMAEHLLLVGLGHWSDLTLDTIRSASGETAKQISNLGATKYVNILPGEGSTFNFRDRIGALVEGAELASYTFNRFKTRTNELPKALEELTILLKDSRDIPDAMKSIIEAQKACEAVKLARDIANAPSSDMTPSMVADVAIRMAKDCGLKCTILEKQDIERLGMGGLLSVSKGSQQPPRMVLLEYKGAAKELAPIVLVGKGVTFDSGGISIKPSEKMEEMKYDKSGAAAVIATMQAIAFFKVPLNVVAIAPLTENLPSGTAYKPSDVVKHYGGKTTEIINTDAEGRLILADALAYAAEMKPQAIIDLATLTGACVVALGSQASGLFTNDERLMVKVKQSAEATAERVWPLPLWKEFSDQIKSEVADMKNSGGRSAGAITAAAFLSNFVDQCPWVHLDIAGTAWTAEDGTKIKSYNPKGATGVGVRLLIHILRNWSNID